MRVADLFDRAFVYPTADAIRLDPELPKRTDAFVSRFGRLQNTVADKLLPNLLCWVAEPVGATYGAIPPAAILPSPPYRRGIQHRK